MCLRDLSLHWKTLTYECYESVHLLKGEPEWLGCRPHNFPYHTVRYSLGPIWDYFSGRKLSHSVRSVGSTSFKILLVLLCLLHQIVRVVEVDSLVADGICFLLRQEQSFLLYLVCFRHFGGQEPSPPRSIRRTTQKSSTQQDMFI